jgi:hypothetical protein
VPENLHKRWLGATNFRYLCSDLLHVWAEFPVRNARRNFYSLPRVDSYKTGVYVSANAISGWFFNRGDPPLRVILAGRSSIPASRTTGTLDTFACGGHRKSASTCAGERKWEGIVSQEDRNPDEEAERPSWGDAGGLV